MAPSDGQTVRIWDAGTGALVVEPLLGHTGFADSAVFSPDGSRVASVSEDQTIRI